jgi:trimethylamine---corrinoid protein Co-methyltransferase
LQDIYSFQPVSDRSRRAPSNWQEENVVIGSAPAISPIGPSVLSESQVLALDRASRQVLAEVGVRVPAGLLEEYAGGGVNLDKVRGILHIEPAAIDDALRTVPRAVHLFPREDGVPVSIGQGHPPRFAAGFNATFDWDPVAGQRRRPGVGDVAECARISHHLREIDVVGPLFIPHDVPSRTSLLHALAAVLENTTKPVLFAPENDAEAEAALELLRAAGGDEAVSRRPVGLCQFSPSSPLFWNEGTLCGFLRVVRAGLPCTILPGPLAGATSPYTLAANLVQKNAEMLCGLVISQRVNPGAPVLCYNGGGQFDMSGQCAVFGTPEIALILMAGTQLARHYGIPSHACIPCSDSHTPDVQLGFENGVLFMAGLASGTHLMVNAGMFASGETGCREQLVLDDGAIANARRIARGITVDDEHLCMDAFRRAGPGGSYLDDPVTIDNLRSGEWSAAGIWQRGRFESWQAAGSPTIVERARAKGQELCRRAAPVQAQAAAAAVREVARKWEGRGRQVASRGFPCENRQGR